MSVHASVQIYIKLCCLSHCSLWSCIILALLIYDDSDCLSYPGLTWSSCLMRIEKFFNLALRIKLRQSYFTSWKCATTNHSYLVLTPVNFCKLIIRMMIEITLFFTLIFIWSEISVLASKQLLMIKIWTTLIEWS